MTRAKRARLGEAPPWLHVETGVWELVFKQLAPVDLRSARAVCKEFQLAASRTVHKLCVGESFESDTKLPACWEVLSSQVCGVPGSLTSLRTVCISNSRHLVPTILFRLENLRHLTHVHLDGGDTILTAQAMLALSFLPALRRLTFEAYSFAEGEALALVPQLRGLKHLTLNRCQPHHENLLSAIAQLTGLTALELCKPFCFKDQGYSALSSLSNLLYLHIGWTWRLGSEGESLSFLTGLTRLRSLALTKCFVSDAELAWVAHLRDLQHLRIRWCHNFSGSVFRELAGLTQLRELDLEGDHLVADRGVRYLAAITSLETLNLGSARLTLGVFPALEALPNLRHLVVPNELHARPPASVRNNLIPRLKTFSCMSTWKGRAVGRIEEHLLGLVEREVEIMNDPAISSRILEWFQRGAR